MHDVNINIRSRDTSVLLVSRGQGQATVRYSVTTAPHLSIALTEASSYQRTLTPTSAHTSSLPSLTSLMVSVCRLATGMMPVTTVGPVVDNICCFYSERFFEA